MTEPFLTNALILQFLRTPEKKSCFCCCSQGDIMGTLAINVLDKMLLF